MSTTKASVPEIPIAGRPLAKRANAELRRFVDPAGCRFQLQQELGAAAAPDSWCGRGKRRDLSWPTIWLWLVPRVADVLVLGL
jgi:hypothetical protein